MLNIVEQPDITLPKLGPRIPLHRPQQNIPQTSGERDKIKKQVADFIEKKKPVPPVPMAELKVFTDEFLSAANINSLYRDYVAVLMNNESWKDTLAAIPFDRRLLLIPKCLRSEEQCPASFDEFGLICKKCGLCTIPELQEEAERLGYAVLVAEGSALVTAIIKTGKIDAIVGVGCLNVLERAFPFMEAAAIPGVAIPLLQSDCSSTIVDMDWVWDIVHLTGDDETRRLHLEQLRQEVNSWFTMESLNNIMGEAFTSTMKIAYDWLCRAGKRWRPFLAVCAYQAMQNDPQAELPEDLKKIAVAVECFHKASLIHDDIEDEDKTRYGQKALHEEYDVAIALNIGDYLLGEGYRLLTISGATPEQKSAMLQVAAQGHQSLALGQGAELYWMKHPAVLSSLQVLDIFSKKTAPAFEVAIALGAIYSGCDEDFSSVIKAYSKALGIAYQIRDDLEDFSNKIDPSDIQAQRPSLLMAIAYEKAKDRDKELLKTLWQRSASFTENYGDVEAIISRLDVKNRAEQLLNAYKEEVVRSLRELNNANLKGLLRRVIGKIFNDISLQGWCSELEIRDAANGKVSAKAAG